MNTTSATRAELLLALEAATNPDHMKPWTDVQTRWTPPPTEAMTDPAALDQFIARLAADGLWMYDALAYNPLPPDFRKLIAERIAQTVDPT